MNDTVSAFLDECADLDPETRAGDIPAEGWIAGAPKGAPA